MTDRKHLTQKQAAQLHLKQEGKCAGCGSKLVTGMFEYDHVHDLQFGGDNEMDNWQILCTSPPYRCHQAKTRKAAKQAAHIRNIAVGKKKSQSRPLPGTRASGVRKRMSGVVERW